MKRKPLTKREQESLIQLVKAYLDLIYSDYCYGSKIGGGQATAFARGNELLACVQKKGW